ncbi:MAG: choice-of-anchor D domain-containing protein, partial [Bdellovibrionales bacterium]|nr:choice-of-anchor D domain-containing protein [Bdellovibrionales bacterium]
ATYNFGTQARGSSTDHSFTLTNTGGAQATTIAPGALAAPYTFKGGTYPGTGGTCGATLNISATCTVVVTFSPGANGLFSESLDINYDNGSGAALAQRDMEGTGVDPALLVVDQGPTYDYGTVTVNDFIDHTFTVTNNGGVQATTIAGAGLAAPYTFKGGTFPGTGGTCGVSLAASASCDIVIQLHPTATGTYNDTILVNYNDGAAAQQATRDLTAIANTPALLNITEAPFYDFGVQPLGSTSEYSFTISNSGGSPATGVSGTGLAAPFAYKDGTYPGTGGTCGATINASANCTIIVTFAPTVAGVANDTIQIDYFDSVNAAVSNRNVQGEGAAAAFLEISQAPLYDYGTKAVGSNTDFSFVVTNTGSVSASSMADGLGLAAPFSFKGGTYPGTGGTCGAGLAASATCTVIVTYSPVATGAHSDTIVIGYNNGASAQTAQRNVQGTGANPADLVISDAATYDYGSKGIGSTTDYTFTITNNGGVPANTMADAGVSGLAAPFTYKGGTYPGTGGTCSAGLAASATCTIVVRYAPTALGFASDTILIDYNDGLAMTQSTRDVQGTSANPALLTFVEAPSYDFGTKGVGSSSDKTLNITNSGGVSATALADAGGLASPFTFKGGAYPGTGGSCGVTLAASATCTVVVTFSPSATGAVSDTVIVDYNNGSSAQQVSMGLDGTGASLAFLTITDGPTYDYNTIAVGQTVDHTFTVQNTGGVDATAVSGSGLIAPFTFKGGSYPGTGGTCAATLTSSATCTIVVSYTPATLGLHTDTILIDYNDGDTVQQVTRDVQGTGANTALLSISDGATYDFGVIAQGAIVEHTFTVDNTGGVQA